MSLEEYASFLARNQKHSQTTDGVDQEQDLHEHILNRCRAKGWLAFHGSMAHRTHRVRGEPDFIIWADNGRTIAVECKRKGGKTTPEQNAVIAFAENLGHKVHVISKIEEWDKLENTK